MSKPPEPLLAPEFGLSVEQDARGVCFSRSPSELDGIMQREQEHEQEHSTSNTPELLQLQETNPKKPRTNSKSKDNHKTIITSPTWKSKKKATQKERHRDYDCKYNCKCNCNCYCPNSETMLEASGTINRNIPKPISSTETAIDHHNHTRRNSKSRSRSRTRNSRPRTNAGSKRISTPKCLDTVLTTTVTDHSSSVSVASTADTAPSTPSTMKLSLKSNLTTAYCFDSNSTTDLATMPTSFPTISEQEEYYFVPTHKKDPATKKKESTVKKDKDKDRGTSKRGKDTSKKGTKKTKEKDKKKSKKNKKKKKKTKATEKKKPKKKKTLSKHFGSQRSQRSVGSFGSQKSFGSQRSLGSFVSERSLGERSFVSFVSVPKDATIVRKMPKGSRKVPLVSMPEYSDHPETTRKAFNDNVLLHTSFHSIDKNNFNASLRNNNTHSEIVTPTLLAKTPLYEASTPTTVTESPSSRIGSEYSTFLTMPKIKMVPKSQSSPLHPKGHRGIQQRIKDISNKGETFNKVLPMTKFCSAPKATHPNAAVAKAWTSPFDDVDVMYADDPDTKDIVPLKGTTSIVKDDDSDSKSELSDIEDPWESYGPSESFKSNNSRASLSYDHEDDLSAISAITMSTRTRTDRSRGTSRGRTIIATRGESPGPNDPNRRGGLIKPRSPIPQRSNRSLLSIREGEDRFTNLKATIGEEESVNRKDSSGEEGSINPKDTSGEEGSISLHDSSVRTSSPVRKGTIDPFSYRHKKAPTVPRYHTPMRIRFGEGHSDPNSPRARDQSPSVPERLPSRHNRGDEDMIVGIPVLPNLFDSRPICEEHEEESKSRTHTIDTEMSSHGICDDADAAAGMSSHTHPLTPSHELETEKPRLESFPKSPGRFNNLVDSFEAMETIDGLHIRSPSPSLHKRKPKNLQPMQAESRDVPDNNMLSMSPSLPDRLPKRNGSCASMTNSKTESSPSGRTKMAIKDMRSSLFDTSAHSSAKEIILGTTSDWMGSPKKVVRDTSYNIDTCSDSQGVSSKSSLGTSPSNRSPRRRSKENRKIAKTTKALMQFHVETCSDSKGVNSKRTQVTSPTNKSLRRRSKESRNIAKTTKALMESHTSCGESIGKNETKPKRRRSTGKNKTKAERRRSTGKNATRPGRRRSKEKSETKSERRRSTGMHETTPEKKYPPSPRRRSNTPEGRKSTPKNEKRFQTSPRRGSRSPNKFEQGTCDGKTSQVTERDTSRRGTPIQRVKRFGRGLVGLTPKSKDLHTSS